MTEVHEVYGPAAAFSEHRRGDHISYRKDKGTFEGEILWVKAAQSDRPIEYIVAPDVPNGFVDIVYPGEVVTPPQETHEPIMVLCPYCPGPGKVYHYEGQLEACPFNPHKGTP